LAKYRNGGMKAPAIVESEWADDEDDLEVIALSGE
jgi:hypothetical protein